MLSTHHRYHHATSLSRCIELLREPTPPHPELRALLRSLKAMSRREKLTLSFEHSTLTINGVAQPPDALSGVRVMLERMQVHHVRSMTIEQFATGVDLLRLCKLLATDATPGEPTISERAMSQRIWNARLQCTAEESSDEGTGPESDLEAEVEGGHEMVVRIRTLRRKNDTALISSATGEIVTAAESAANEGDAATVRGIVLAVAEGEQVVASAPNAIEAREAWDAVLERLITPAIIQHLVQALPGESDPTLALSVLARSREIGAKALINHLMAAPTIEERRAFCDAIVSIRAGIPLLIDALHHPQWYVVRNAALLLGQMRATEADQALIGLLEHPDDRVRKAAADALASLATPDALSALQRVLRDSSPEVRQHAATAFALRAREGGSRFATPLASALDVENDDDVQIEIIAALGRLGTPDAVQRLIKAISPNGAGNRPVEFRIAAAEALAQARGKSAMPALRILLTDHEPALRECAKRVIASLALQ